MLVLRLGPERVARVRVVAAVSEYGTAEPWVWEPADEPYSRRDDDEAEDEDA